VGITINKDGIIIIISPKIQFFVIPVKTGIQESNAGCPRIKYGAGISSPA